ncbi:MAG TPA: exodeoxyribonuclease VII large subunit [Candidatus Ventrousia excrementavium]|uniref:Exodeoxyribonuclease 7 large subunit n=1 Tax=Candidatus Ventrousia excrementavium TaxID=2840961 RepID=A0A9D1S138_9CLOT|nr:exodeoxyribonuclease VII large subunit [Candidatus Ventrousia excrementavium]
MTAKPLSVTEVSAYIKALLDHDEVLGQLCVRGELSNYKMHSSGHHYFTLKDDGAVINAVMFRSDASRLPFQPGNGMKVIVYGRVSSFPKSGQYQIYVSQMQPDGVGALYVAFEQLKEKLLREGLFDKDVKKTLPRYPRRIALVTSPTGAAVRDMIRVLGRRFPACEVLVCPVKVQGEGAAQEIAAMLAYVDQHHLADVIITGRGGGSIEDLWAFNEEVVARAIFACQTPVISAVGHEPDVTIADFVADVRAATPSNAAELAVCDAAELRIGLRNLLSHMTRSVLAQITERRARLDAIASKRIMSSPYEYLNERSLLLSMQEQRMTSAMAALLAEKRKQYVHLAATMDAISPLKVLSRGYSMVQGEQGVVKSAADVVPGDRLTVRFSDGRADCLVQSVEKEEK